MFLELPEEELEYSSSIPLDIDAQTAWFAKIYVGGFLSAHNRDNRLVMRVNGLKTGYRSYILMSGDRQEGYWDATGFYLGRNNWGNDAHYSAEITLTSSPKDKTLSVFGQSNFYHTLDASISVLGCQFYGAMPYPVAGDVRQLDFFCLAGGWATAYVNAEFKPTPRNVNQP